MQLVAPISLTRTGGTQPFCPKVGLLMLAMAGLALGTAPSSAADKSDVRVVNTAAEPVPTTAVGTVNVVDKTEFAREPYSVVLGWESNSPPSPKATVPAGKRFVIEFVSGEIMTVEDHVVAARITILTPCPGCQSQSDYWFPPTHVYSYTTIDTWRFGYIAQPTKLYAGPGDIVGLNPSATPDLSKYFKLNVILTGYLIAN
jgi:hypothetical protein